MVTKSKKITSWFFGILLLLAVWFAMDCYRAWYMPFKIIDKTSVKVHPGSGVEELAQELQQQGLLTNPHLFLFLARIHETTRQMRYGEYAITPGMNISTLLSNISQGRGMVQHKITFIEGWTFAQMLQALAQDPVIKHTLTGKTLDEIMRMIGFPGQKPEGLFFPNTYHFIWGKADVDVLRMAYKKMQSVMQEQWPLRANNIPFTDSYHALIAASLIEKETAIASERPIIAGVMVRRMQKGMRLQVDPTVLYGLGKAFGLPITKADLASDTPYNTYRIMGLPPTPINMPGLESIKAALHPDNSQYLFYVARGDGTHVFSATYEQHLAAVKQYRLGERQNARPVGTAPLMLPYHHSGEWWHAVLSEFSDFLIFSLL